MDTKKLLRLTGVAFVGAALAVPAAHAQLDEIVVTAQKRAESVNDVPIAINALSGDRLEGLGISDTDDIIEAFPNLGSNVRSAYNSGVSIRGVGTDNFHISGQQSVGTYIDDVSLISPFISTIGVFDMDRVEVLRGPQNTLYGRNTTGGAIVWHTKKAAPGDGMNGYASAGAGEGGLRELEGAVGFDVSDRMAVRIAAMRDDFDGLWQDVITGKDTGGGYERTGARFNLQFELSSNTSLNIGFSYGETEGEDNAYAYRGNLNAMGRDDMTVNTLSAEAATRPSDYYIRVSALEVEQNPFLAAQYASNNMGMVRDNPNPPPTAAPPPPPRSLDRLVNYSTDFGKTYVHPEAGYEAEWEGIKANLVHSFDGFADLTVLASYDEASTFGVNIADLTGFGAAQDGEWEVLQLETRLTSNGDGDFRWLVGAYYSTEDSKQDTWLRNGAAANGQGAVPGIDIDSEYTSLSIYGQGDYQHSDAWNFTLGLRYTDDELDGDWAKTTCGFAASLNGLSDLTRDVRAADCPGFRPGRIAGPRVTTNPKQELSELGWKIGADYSFAEDSLLYASVSEGFKGGAYDNRPVATGNEPPIGPEFLTAYEVGFKSSLADRRLQLNGAVFLYDWEDLQLFDIIQGTAHLLNVPETELMGAEFEAQYAPNDNWYFQAAVGLVDTEVKSVTGLPANSNVDAGNEVTNTPDFTANLLASYTTELAGGEIGVTASWRHASSYLYTFNQDLTRHQAPSQDYVNADITYAFGDSLQHSVRLYGKNLTEEFHCSGIQDGPPGRQNYSCRIASFGEQQIGINFRTNF